MNNYRRSADSVGNAPIDNSVGKAPTEDSDGKTSIAKVVVHKAQKAIGKLF